MKYWVDKDWYILTDVDYKNINPIFLEMVNDVVDHIIKSLSDKLISIYIYWSVVRGTAIVWISDLDVQIILKRKESISTRNKIKNLEKILSDKYIKLVRWVWISRSYKSEVETNYYWRISCLKHTCVCVYGTDLAKDAPKFKPCKKLAKGFNWDIKQILESYLWDLTNTSDKEQIKQICSSMMRKIVRTWFSIVMEKEQSWTTDLQKSYEIFAQYYPHKIKEMKYALKLSTSPISDKLKIIDFINSFGKWIIKEIKKQLN